MIKYISADWIFPVSSLPIKNGVIGIQVDGEILEVLTEDEANLQKITSEKYIGAIVPGFINTHCHLELSHMFGLIPEQTGLPEFVRQIVAKRASTDEMVIDAMQKADSQMYENGIVAVGDISNQLISKNVKEHSKLYYHTFVEVFGFNQPSGPIIEQALKMRSEYSPLNVSIVPHAPYSVSKELFKYIEKNTRPQDILSIHNQETQAENDFFEKGTGDFEAMYQRIGAPKSEAHGNGQNAIRYHLPQMPKNKTLLVHNSFTNRVDLNFATAMHKDLYWCLCPNANLYIENNLPDISVFLDTQIKVTLGTDSLASNHQLSILSEMQVLQQKKGVAFDDLLKWATLNGAEFLNISAQYGSIEKGKKPGLNLVELDEDFNIGNNKVIKLI